MNQLCRIRLEVFGATQEEMATIAGVSQATVSRWEAGQMQPTLRRLKRIRAAAQARRLKWNDRWFFAASGGEA